LTSSFRKILIYNLFKGVKQHMGKTRAFVPPFSLFLSLSLLLAPACSKKGAPGPVALTVNGQTITVAEVDEAAEFFRQQRSAVSPGLLFEGGVDVRRAAARQLAANMLLIAEAKILGLRADSALVEAAAANFAAQFPDRQTFLSQLAGIGESEESMRKGLAEELLLDSLFNAVGGAAEPAGDEECRAHYEKNAARYAEPEKARVSHIVFRLEPDAADSLAKIAMVSAQEALKKAAGGADFDALVKEYSPQYGGDLGWFKRGDIPDLDRKVFSMKKGEISGPVPTGMGIHVLKKTDEMAPRQMSYAEAEPGIRAGLTEQKKAKRINAYVDSLIGAADVRYADTTLAMKQ
jgi:parvulin-like peptidyl-prolyl isomerase